MRAAGRKAIRRAGTSSRAFTPTLERQLTVADAAVTARCELGRKHLIAATRLTDDQCDTLLRVDANGVFEERLSIVGDEVLGQIAGMSGDDIETHIGDLFEFVNVEPDPRMVGALVQLGYLNVVAA